MFHFSRFTVGLCSFADYVALTVFQLFCDLKTGDAFSLRTKWKDPGWNPETLAPQAKSIATTTTPKAVSYVTYRKLY